MQQYETILKHIDTMINFVLSFNDESNKENTNKYQTAAYNYLKSIGLTDVQLEQCIQKITTILCYYFIKCVYVVSSLSGRPYFSLASLIAFIRNTIFFATILAFCRPSSSFSI